MINFKNLQEITDLANRIEFEFPNGETNACLRLNYDGKRVGYVYGSDYCDCHERTGTYEIELLNADGSRLSIGVINSDKTKWYVRTDGISPALMGAYTALVEKVYGALRSISCMGFMSGKIDELANGRFELKYESGQGYICVSTLVPDIKLAEIDVDGQAGYPYGVEIDDKELGFFYQYKSDVFINPMSYNPESWKTIYTAIHEVRRKYIAQCNENQKKSR